MVSMTYLSLKIILPYMDPNTRFNLCHKCPAISQILKHLPVTIDHIQLGITNIVINGTTYTLHSHANSAHAVPKDNNHQLVGKHFIRLSRDGEVVERVFPTKNLATATQYMYRKFLKDGNFVIDTLSILGYGVPSFPTRLRVNNLKCPRLRTYDSIDQLEQIISDDSFPVESIEITIDESIIHHPFIQNAQKLIIMEQTEFNRQLVPIHRNAYLKNVACFRWQMMHLIIFWKEGNCAVGTHLAMETTGGFGLESMRFPVEDELVGRKAIIKNKMSNQDMECINVPMENNLEINIYIEQLNPERNIVHFEVYPHGYATIV
ncbi:hypothetical protein GCK72_007689 [Caenorhabditis remanei]|uniref:DUF38 domain-containing protein n=1 Tax=Caenorhabditis remanei TaxID=31234 RepID=A0A6A5HHX5_CAERE|nr:hypothetical protein GCK72_007689 [Caenorhabditis remanei]KAF1767730.1 hypothetical protein GCK72_007689 [Caenorhabditis remanei]